VRLFRAFVVVSTVLGAAGCLMADIPDPTIRLTIPGTGTLSLCVPPTGQATCTDNFTQDNGVNLIGTNGFASFVPCSR